MKQTSHFSVTTLTLDKLHSTSLISCSLNSCGLLINSVVAAAKQAVIGSLLISFNETRCEDFNVVESNAFTKRGTAPAVAKAHT